MGICAIQFRPPVWRARPEFLKRAMPESSKHIPDLSGAGSGEKTPDSHGVAKPDPNELVMLTCSVFMLMHKRNSEGQVVATECHEIPRITTRQDAEDLMRDGLIPPDCIAPLNPPPPADGPELTSNG